MREWYNNSNINFIITSTKINHLLIADDQPLIFRIDYELQKAIPRLQTITQEYNLISKFINKNNHFYRDTTSNF